LLIVAFDTFSLADNNLLSSGHCHCTLCCCLAAFNGMLLQLLWFSGGCCQFCCITVGIFSVKLLQLLSAFTNAAVTSVLNANDASVTTS